MGGVRTSMTFHEKGPDMSNPVNPNSNNQDNNFNQGEQNMAPNHGAFPNGGGMPSKKLYRSANDRMIAGVCGGFAETYNMDPTLVRVIFVALTLLGFSGVLLYLICWVVIPDGRY